MVKFRQKFLTKATIPLCLLISIPIYVLFHLQFRPNLAHYELVVNEKMHKIYPRNRIKGIAIFVMVEESADLEGEYKIAHRTLQCYCLANGYPLVVLDLSSNATLQRLCPQKDFMFRRHCAFAHFLQDHPTVEWALFMDADMAVVNPNNLLEKFLPSEKGRHTKVDLIFYERIFNGEIVAGSYFSRNTNSAVNFLHFWANYYYKLPWSWHGTDNGAIHAVFLDQFCPGGCSTRREICWKLWRKSKDDDGLRMFTDCAKWLLGKRNRFESKEANLTLEFRTDFRHFWARDIWLTGSKWAANDFLLHGLKRSWHNLTKWGGWQSPFSIGEEELAQKLDSDKCSEGRAEWPHDAKLLTSNTEIERTILRRVQETRAAHVDYLRRIEEFAQMEDVL